MPKSLTQNEKFEIFSISATVTILGGIAILSGRFWDKFAARSNYQALLKTLEPKQTNLSVQAKILPHMRTTLPWFNHSFQRKLLREYKENPITSLILKIGEIKLKKNELKILIDTPHNVLLSSTLHGFYDSHIGRQPLPHIVLQPRIKFSLDISHSEEGKYLGVILHELTHATDDLVLNFSLSPFEEKKIKYFSFFKIKIKYQNPILNELDVAVKKDFNNLYIANPRVALGISNIVGLIKTRYPDYRFLDEIRALYVELCSLNSFGPEVIKAALPEISAWFERYFIPGCQAYLAAQKLQENPPAPASISKNLLDL